VIIPVYNGAATLARAIGSVLSQDYTGSIEVIAVNDGSTDATADILENYDKCIETVTQPNRGLAAARNAGAIRASGELLAFLDADDAWFPAKLAILCAALRHKNNAVLAYSDIVAVGEDGLTQPQEFIREPLRHAPSMDELLKCWWPILPSTVIMRREIFQRCGGFCEDYRRAYEDVDMWLRAREFGEFIFVSEKLVRYRITPVTDRMRKYANDYPVFERRIRSRYQSRAGELIHSMRQAYVSELGLEGLVALDDRDRQRARQAFLAAWRFDRWHLRTILRLVRTMLPWPLMRLLSRRTRKNSVSGDRGVANTGICS